MSKRHDLMNQLHAARLGVDVVLSNGRQDPEDHHLLSLVQQALNRAIELSMDTAAKERPNLPKTGSD
jgi:hypothetical protein